MFEDLAADGNELIFGTSFGYMDPMLAAAENYPGRCLHARHRLQGRDNMGNYFGAAEEGRYLSGMAAGAATETDLIGYVAHSRSPRCCAASTPSPSELRKSTRRQVQVVWTSTWFDPPIEGTAAQSLLDAGADVIAMHQDSAAPARRPKPPAPSGSATTPT